MNDVYCLVLRMVDQCNISSLTQMKLSPSISFSQMRLSQVDKVPGIVEHSATPNGCVKKGGGLLST